MAYALTCHTPDKLLYLTIDGQTTIQELVVIDEEVTAILDTSHEKMCIVIDVNRLEVNYQTVEQLRLTQSYMDHKQLNLGLIITDNKLSRLITMMAFSAARTKVIQCLNFDIAVKNLKQRGFMQESYDAQI